MLQTAIIFLVILSVLVFVHELGHYLMARFIGVTVEEFGFGLPPRIFGKKIGQTLYSLNWLPIGGFVRLAGEDEENPPEGSHHQAKYRHYFWARSKKERSAILLAGVTMNLALAILLTAFLLVRGVMEPSGRVHVVSVGNNTPAFAAGLKENDIIQRVAQSVVGAQAKQVTSSQDVITFTKMHAGELLLLTVVRNGQALNLTLTPRKQFPPNEGPMGISISELERRQYPVPEALAKAVTINFTRAKEMFTALGTLVYRLLTFHSVGADIAGPIGIAQVTGQAVKFGLDAVIEFMSILSLNLAVLNVLPIPALDGGRLLFVFVEKILGKKVRPAFERTAHQFGMLILIALILLVSINDILRIARGG